MPARILFLSASVGVGHTAAAAAVRAALDERYPGEFECEIVDSYKYAASIFSKLVSNGYIGMVKTIPQLYRYIYDQAERATKVGSFKTWVNQFTAAKLRTMVERSRADVVVCTHAFPCGVMAEYKRQFGEEVPVMGIVTDFALHPFWIYRNIDAYCVATAEMRTALAARGVAPERIHVSGIPVNPSFALGGDRAELRRSLGLPVDRSLVLIMGGGLGIGPVDKMMRALEGIETPLTAVVIVGKNAPLERRLRDLAETLEYPLRVVGFVDNVYDYMHAADVLLTKPGGLTTSEALSAELPMVLVKPLPGQEERNTRFLLERRAAVRVASLRSLPQVVGALLDDPARLATMRRRMSSLRKPLAALEAADVVAELARRRRAGAASGAKENGLAG
ncbi:MAG TPA: glycosyltransferase [Candidatus Dormibacteraeota bacterium]|nr:glycosyltransferase [Candidatus Dormibacteraeota bacterium]